MAVVPTVALKGHGIAELFSTAVAAVREAACPLPQPVSKHIGESLQPLSQALNRPEIIAAFHVPQPLLLMRFAAGDRYFHDELRQHFPQLLPGWRALLSETWTRTRDILTIVTPLLVGGSVVLALLNHVGADAVINTVLTPVTAWWLGLPVVLGVPILFGILRKELSLLMIYQALGTFEVGALLDWVQIMTLLLFLTFYIPCISTFAVMLKTIGRREALFSVVLSVSIALAVSGAIRLLLEGTRLFAA